MAPARWPTQVSVVAGIALLFVSAWTLILSSSTAAWSYDFRAYFDAANRLVQTGSPYQPEMLLGVSVAHRFLYTPLVALMFIPSTALSIQVAGLLWGLLNVTLLGLCCALMPVPRDVRLAVLAVGVLSPAVFSGLDLGQVNVIVLLCSVVLWRWLDQRIGSWAVAVALNMRLPMAIILVWWGLRVKWRLVGATAVLMTLMVLVTLPFVSVQRWSDFLAVAAHGVGAGTLSSFDFGSVVAATGGPAWASPLALAGSYLVGALAVLWSLRRDREISLIVTVMATLLLSPVLQLHYLTALLLPAALMAGRGRTWGVLLPLLTWVPGPLLPFVALLGMILPFTLPDRGDRAFPNDANGDFRRALHVLAFRRRLFHGPDVSRPQLGEARA